MKKELMKDYVGNYYVTKRIKTSDAKYFEDEEDEQGKFYLRTIFNNFVVKQYNDN